LQQQGAFSQIIGGVFVGIMGVIAIAAIYQLNKPNTPLVPATQSVANNTLGAIFK
jgi:hypothetical protein